MAKSSRRDRCCSTKRRILVALAAVIVATGIICVVSVVLRPAKIRFSITNAHSAMFTAADGTVEGELNFTIAANNTSHRAGVRYHSVLVSLQYTSPAPDLRNYSIQAHVLRSEPWSQPPSSTGSVNVSASMEPWMSDFPKPSRSDRRSNPTLIRVLVVTMVQFKVGPAYTWQYPIRALCDSEDYFFNRSLANRSIHCRDA